MPLSNGKVTATQFHSKDYKRNNFVILLKDTKKKKKKSKKKKFFFEFGDLLKKKVLNSDTARLLSLKTLGGKKIPPSPPN